MKILVGKLKDLWPELTVPMSIPKKIDESKEKLIGNLKPHRSIENNDSSTLVDRAGNREYGNQHQSTSNNNKESPRDSDKDDEDDEEEEGICFCFVSKESRSINKEKTKNQSKTKIIECQEWVSFYSYT